MDETKKMLRAIINGQSAMKQELLGEIGRVDEKLTLKMGDVEKNLTARIDMIGKQMAFLDDDAPSGEEFEELKRRVTVVEHKVALAG